MSAHAVDALRLHDLSNLARGRRIGCRRLKRGILVLTSYRLPAKEIDIFRTVPAASAINLEYVAVGRVVPGVVVGIHGADEEL